MKSLFAICFLLVTQSVAADWFEDLKARGDQQELYRTLYYMPKGGDLHNHLSGSNFSEWLYELALDEGKRGYRYYTKVRIENCIDYGANDYGRNPYYLMFRTIMEIEFDALSECEQKEYRRLEELDDNEKSGWLNSIRLDKPHEGRDEFFGTHWPRMNALGWNPWLQAETLYRNMQAFGEEGLSYLETQVSVAGFQNPDGSPIGVAAGRRYPESSVARGRCHCHRSYCSLSGLHFAIRAKRRRNAAVRLQIYSRPGAKCLSP